jgi:hypothetical protein
METEGSLLCLNEPSTGSIRNNMNSIHIDPIFSKIHFNIVL